MTTKRITFEQIEDFFSEELDMDRVFHSLERADYVLLRHIENISKSRDDDRVYLRELGESMGVGMQMLSRMITSVQDKGYVLWLTKEDKSGTYVVLTEGGIKRIEKEKEEMRETFSKIKRTIPHEDLEITLDTFQKISGIIKKQCAHKDTIASS